MAAGSEEEREGQWDNTILRSRWVDHLLKIPVLKLWYARAGHAENVNNAKGMPFPVYGAFCLTTFLCVYDSEVLV